jgi:ubiquinone/menaquinone biosynthesis C-methylase UbiE
MSYMDHFGEKSLDYLLFRPDYPDALYKYLATLTNKHDLAWDCGTGNGQAAVKLASYFKQVIGSDLNQAQLDAAIRKENIRYACWPAEKTGLADHAVDLITVAQALHWFQFDTFYQEVKRVADGNGVIAAWAYSLGSINQDIDVWIHKLYTEMLGDKYWPKERRYIDDEYQSIPFPFQKIPSPSFIIEKKMNFMQLMGYLSTWSAVKEYQKINHDDPLDLIYPDLQKVWGEPSKEYIMKWPLHLLVGKIK